MQIDLASMVFLLVLAYSIAVASARAVARGPFPASLADLVVLGAGAFHVLPEVARAFASIPAGMYRDGLPESALCDWLGVVSAAFIAFSTGIVLGSAMPHTPHRPSAPLELGARERRFVTLLWAASVASGIASILGYGTGTFEGSNYLLGGILGMVWLPLAISSAVAATILRRGELVWFAFSAAVLALSGSRSLIAWAALSWVVLVRKAGCRMRVPQVALVLLIGVLLVVLIVLVRSSAGRWSAESSLHERVSVIRDAAEQRDGSRSVEELFFSEFLNRMDGNGYGAWIMHAQLGLGTAPMGWSSLIETTKIVVPSFLWPDKLATPSGTRNQEGASVAHYDLAEVDYLPTWLGAATSLVGPIQSVIGAGLLGMIVGLIDRHVSAGRLASMPLLAGLCVALLYFEGGVEDLLVRLRAACAAGVASWFLWVLSGFGVCRRRIQPRGYPIG